MKKQWLLLGMITAIAMTCYGQESYHMETSVWTYSPDKGKTEQTMSVSSVGMKNPFLYYKTTQELERDEGKYPLPSYMPEHYTLQNIAMMDHDGKSFAQLIYRDKDNRIIYRVSKNQKELNGDQEEYVKTMEIIDDTRVYCLGTREGVKVMQWEDSNYYYCVMSDEPLAHRDVILIKRGIK